MSRLSGQSSRNQKSSVKRRISDCVGMSKRSPGDDVGTWITPVRKKICSGECQRERKHCAVTKGKIL